MNCLKVDGRPGKERFLRSRDAVRVYSGTLVREGRVLRLDLPRNVLCGQLHKESLSPALRALLSPFLLLLLGLLGVPVEEEVGHHLPLKQEEN